MPSRGEIAKLRTGNPDTQIDWHDTHRDMWQNMYRTSYSDMVHGREVCVKNEFPAGYGGHIPSLRHDVLFRNTAFDRMRTALREDPFRDTFPSFSAQNEGVPSSTRRPRGVPKAPTFGTAPDVLVKPPWGLTLALREQPSFRTSPRSTSSRIMSARGQSSPAQADRVNKAAMNAGNAVTFRPNSPKSDFAPGAETTAGLSARGGLKKEVDAANAAALSGKPLTEVEVLLQSKNS